MTTLEIEGETSGRRRCVDRSAFIGEHLQPDIPLAQILCQLDGMADIAAETIELPDNQNVTGAKGF